MRLPSETLVILPYSKGLSMSGSGNYIADSNRVRIMRALIDNGPLSRVEIAQASGLSPATVTRNIAYLMTIGMLAEDTARVRTEGRSRIPVVINASYGRIAIIALTFRGAMLYQYDMALEPCAEPVALSSDISARDLPRAVEVHFKRCDSEFEKTLRAVGILHCDDAWDLVDGLSESLSHRLEVPVLEQRMEECAEYKILHDETEEASDNHVLVSLGSEILVGIAQGGQPVPLRGGSYAVLSKPFIDNGELEAKAVDRLMDFLTIVTSLFTVDAIFMMGVGCEALLAGIPVDLRDIARTGDRLEDLPPVVVLSQSTGEMSRIMTAQIRNSLLCSG